MFQFYITIQLEYSDLKKINTEVSSVVVLAGDLKLQALWKRWNQSVVAVHPLSESSIGWEFAFLFP